MKEVILGILALLLLHGTNADSSTDQRRYYALKFGQSQNDYVHYKPDMQPFETAFTVCAWIRKLRSEGYPTWFSYSTSSTDYEIELGDDGSETRIFGDRTHDDLRSLYTDHVSVGTWYHNCLSWDLATQSRSVYVNGVLVNSTATPAGRKLGLDGYLVLGNEQNSPNYGMDSNNIFGGELFNLNVFSKKLNQSEVQEMASQMCSEVEETYGDVRSIKWEEILLQTKNGDVAEVTTTRCVIIKQLRATILQTKEMLNGTLEELERIKEEKETYSNNLKSKSDQLSNTEAELEKSRSDLNDKEQQLNTTEAQKRSTIKDLDKTTEELNITATALNQTRSELESVKALLEKTVNDTLDCPLNSTVTSRWDFLYSEEFLGEIVTAEKLKVLRRSVNKLEYFEGMRVTDGVIRFFKLFHDGDDQCPNTNSNNGEN